MSLYVSLTHLSTHHLDKLSVLSLKPLPHPLSPPFQWMVTFVLSGTDIFQPDVLNASLRVKIPESITLAIASSLCPKLLTSCICEILHRRLKLGLV